MQLEGQAEGIVWEVVRISTFHLQDCGINLIPKKLLENVLSVAKLLT